MVICRHVTGTHSLAFCGQTEGRVLSKKATEKKGHMHKGTNREAKGKLLSTNN